MEAIRLGIGLLWVLSWLGGLGVWDSATTSRFTATPAEITAQSVSPAGESFSSPSAELDDSIEPQLDLLGNEVEDALADYRIDLGGGIYERHSPETAVPRLGSPST